MTQGFLLNKELMQKVLDLIVKQPYADVYPIVDEILKLKPINVTFNNEEAKSEVVVPTEEPSTGQMN